MITQLPAKRIFSGRSASTLVASTPFSVPISVIFNLAILEHKIPGFFVIRMPPVSFALSSFEHTFLSNVSKEFLPPSTALFRGMKGFPAGVFVPSRNCVPLYFPSATGPETCATGATIGDVAIADDSPRGSQRRPFHSAVFQHR